MSTRLLQQFNMEAIAAFLRNEVFGILVRILWDSQPLTKEMISILCGCVHRIYFFFAFFAVASFYP